MPVTLTPEQWAFVPDGYDIVTQNDEGIAYASKWSVDHGLTGWSFGCDYVRIPALDNYATNQGVDWRDSLVRRPM